jgi:hypothetical protein
MGAQFISREILSRIIQANSAPLERYRVKNTTLPYYIPIIILERRARTFKNIPAFIFGKDILS